MSAPEYSPTFGALLDADGDLRVRRLPLEWGTALPTAGEFAGDLYYLTTGSSGWYYWDGAIWMGPLGVAGGGGGAPVSATYVTMSLNGTLTSERVLTAGAAINIVDGGANGNVTISVPDAGITDAKLRNSAARSVIGRSAGSVGVPADIAAAGSSDHVLKEIGGLLAWGLVLTDNIGSAQVSTAKIADNAVDNTKLSDMPGGRFKGRQVSLGSGNPQDLTAVDARIELGVAATPTGTGFTHITAGAQDAAAKLVDTADVNNDQITYAKMQNVSAASRLLGRGSAGGAGDPEEIVLGTNLSMAGTTLNASGSGTTPTGTGFRHVTAGVEDAAAKLVDTADVNDDQITDAKLRNSAALSVIGRAANTVGDPADIASGALTDHVLRESGGALAFGNLGTNSLGANIVTFGKIQAIPTGTVLGRGAAGTGNVEPLTVAGGLETTATPGLQIADAGVTNAKLANMLQGTVKGRLPLAGTGPPTDITMSSTKGASRVPIGDANGEIDEDYVRPSTGIGIFATRADGDTHWVNRTVGVDNVIFLYKADGTDAVVSRYGDATTFPGTPANGQWCYRTDYKCWFFFDSTAAGWLSSNIFEIEFGIDADIAATAFLKMGDLLLSTTFSSTIGHLIGVQTKGVGISLNMAASGTATVQAFDDGVAVTGATLALSAQQSKADESLFSSAIAASSILGVKVTSGTVEGPARGKVRLRRFETA